MMMTTMMMVAALLMYAEVNIGDQKNIYMEPCMLLFAYAIPDEEQGYVLHCILY